MTETSNPTDGASRLGQVVSGRYRIQELLGEGGMGAVYLAEHTLMRKRVALKLLHPDMSGNDEVLARFRREAEAAAHIEHPNVAAATDFGQTEDGAFFLVLEYIEGTSLRHALFRGGALPVGRALHVTRQIALALERAHAAGIVHRDLKPENVMLVKKGDDADFVKVLDFGIAKVEPNARDGSNQPLTRLGTILGTPEYMAPEQALGEVVGPAADLYAVGVILYEMLTGKHPFDATDSMAVLSMHMIAPVPPMSERAPGIAIDPSVEALVRKLLEKEAKNRYPSARALVEAIESTAAGAGIDIGAPSSAPFSRPSLVNPMSPPPPPSSAHDVDAFAKTSFGTPASPQPPPTGVAMTGHVAPKTTASFDSPLDRLQTLAKKLPRNAVVGIAIGAPVLVLLLVVTLVLSLRSSDATGATDGGVAPSGSGGGLLAVLKSKSAGETKIKAAAAQGTDALEGLAKEYPEDPQVLRHLALAYNERGRIADALRTIRAMVTLGPDGVQAADSEVVGIVIGASGVAETADQAFALLEGPLGARGVDALIDLAQVKSSRQLQLRATRSLAKPDVRAKASPAAAVLLDMKAAKTCTAKRDLMDRAKDEGDARMLGVLRPMKEPRGCGFMGMRDCWSCLRKDASLDDAIAAIEARANK